MVIEAARLAVIVEAQTKEAERALIQYGQRLDGVTQAWQRASQRHRAAVETIARQTRNAVQETNTLRTSITQAAQGVTQLTTSARGAGQALTTLATASRRVSADAERIATRTRQMGVATDAAAKQVRSLVTQANELAPASQRAGTGVEGVARKLSVMSRRASETHRAMTQAAQGITAAANAAEAAERKLTVATRSASAVMAGPGRGSRRGGDLAIATSAAQRMAGDTEGVVAVATQTRQAALAADEAARKLAQMSTQAQGAERAMTATGNAAERAGRQARSGAQGFTIMGQSVERVGATMMRVGAVMTGAVTAPIALMGKTALTSGIQFESAFAGVRKTVDATEPQFAVLRDGIRDMAKEIPAAREEIAGVMEAAGQLGIANEHLLSFTRVAVDMGVATNMASQDAAMSMARFANIVQMPMENIDRLGATVVHLGNNLAATESEIVNMGLRIAGAGHVIGLTEAQILGLAGGLSALGIRAEMGGSAISRTMIEIANAVEGGTEQLELFAHIAGMTIDDFTRLFREDAAGAIVAFIEGLGSARAEGENVFALLEDLGLAEIRIRDMLLRTTGAGDLLRRAIAMGNDGWRENIALTDEARRRYETTASQLQILRNRITDVGVTLFDAFKPDIIAGVTRFGDAIEGIATRIAGADRSLLAFGIGAAGVAAAVGPLLVGVGGLVTLLGGPLVAAIGGATLAVGGLTGGFLALYKSLGDIERASPQTAAALREAFGITQDWGAEIGQMVPSLVAGFATAAQAVIGFVTVLRGGYGVLRNWGMVVELLFKQMDPTRIIAGLANTGAQIKAWATGNKDELERLQAEYAENIAVNWKAAWDALNDDTPWRQLEAGLDLLNNLDTTFNTVRDSIAAGHREVVRFTEGVDEHGRTLEGAGGKLTEFSNAGERAGGVVNGLTRSLEEGRTAAQNFADAQGLIDTMLDRTSAAIGHWDQKLAGAKRALEMLDEKRKKSGKLSEEEQEQYEILQWAVARYSNGITDDLNPAYIAAETRAAEFTQRMDELNGMLKDGTISQEDYNTAMAELATEVDKAFGPNQNLIESNEHLASVIDGLIERFDALLEKLGIIPDKKETEVSAPGLDAVTAGVDDLTNRWNNYPLEKTTAIGVTGDDEARRRIQDVDRALGTLPASFTITATIDTTPFDTAIMHIDRRIPRSPAKEGPLSVPPNWDWLFEGLTTAAERRSKESVEHVKSYLDAIKSGFAAAREGLTFATDASAFRAGGGAMPDAGFVAQLRDASESMITGVGESAGRVSKEFLESASNWSNAVKSGWGAIRDALAFAGDVADARGVVVPAAETVSDLKFASEHMVQSMGDSAATMEAGFLAHAQAYLEAVKGGWGALKEAAAFGRDAYRISMPPDEVVSDLKFRSEHMVRSLGDSAATMDGQFVGAAVTYAGAVKSGFEALSEAAGFARALSDARRFELPSDEVISALKFKAEHLVRSLGDSAAVLDPRFIEDSSRFAGAMKDGFGAIKDALGAARELARVDVRTLSAPDALLDHLIALGKRLVTRLGDASLLFSTQALDEAQGLAGAMKDSFGAVGDALKFAQDAQGATIRGVTVRDDVLDYLPGLARGVVDRLIDARGVLDEDGLDEARGFAETIREMFGALGDALEFAIGASDKTAAKLNPDRIAQRSAALVDTIALVATDLSAASDRLVEEAPDILQNLETFKVTVAPGIAAIEDTVAGFTALAGMSKVASKQADVFAHNMGVVATAIEKAIEPLRKIEESGVLGDFRRIITSIVGALKEGLEALGVKTSGGVTGGGGGGASGSGGVVRSVTSDPVAAGGVTGGYHFGPGTGPFAPSGAGPELGGPAVLVREGPVVGGMVRQTYAYVWEQGETIHGPGSGPIYEEFTRYRRAVPIHVSVSMNGQVVADAASEGLYAGQQLKVSLV